MEPAQQRVRGIPGMPSGRTSSPSSPANRGKPLAGLITCATFLTGSEADKSTLQSKYCGRLVMFLKRLDGVSESSPWKISLFRN
jgi:hypothetical protein